MAATTTRRRANGDAGVYLRKDGRYEAPAYLVTNTGRRKRVRFYGQTREEARRKRDEAQLQARQGIPIPDHNWRLGDYLDYWIENIIRQNRRPTTYIRYESIIRIHLKPHLGSKPLSSLSVPQVQQFLAQQLEDGKTLRTVQIMREVLRSCLSNAQREELIVRNVAARTTLAKRERRLEIKPWSVAETEMFLSVAATEPYFMAFMISAVYGLRRGEVVGLRWADIDFAAGKLRVRQQLQRIRGEIVAGPLKTKAGRRDLALSGPAAYRLLEIKPEGAKDGDLVFPMSDGRAMDPDQLRRRFHRICKRHGLRQTRLHDLRHSLATLLKKLGVQPRDAQLMLGHADITTTMQIYQHGDEEVQEKALQQVERLVLPADDRRYCRQLLPSAVSFRLLQQGWNMARAEGFEAAEGGFSSSCEDRVQSVKQAAEARARCWVLGAIAVSVAVKIPLHPDFEETPCIAA